MSTLQDGLTILLDQPWEGTASELLAALRGIPGLPLKGLPRTASHLSHQLNNTEWVRKTPLGGRKRFRLEIVGNPEEVKADPTVYLVWRRFLLWSSLVTVYSTKELAERRCSCDDGKNLYIEERSVVGI